MKVRMLVLCMCLLVTVTVPLSMLGQGKGIPSTLPGNLSNTIQGYRSAAGHKMLQTSPTPIAKQLLKAVWGEDSTATSFPAAGASGPFVPDPPTCGGSFGRTFNLEPQADAVPQNEESVDFQPGGGIPGFGADLVLEGANDFRGFTSFTFGGVTGYYVHRGPLDNCSVQTEGALPALFGANGAGDPVDKFELASNKFYAADLRETGTVSGVGLLSTPASNLVSPSTCPNGTESISQDATCWPTGIIVDDQGGFFGTAFIDKPDMQPDEASAGSHDGASDVYVTDTAFGIFANNIDLTACTSDLTACNGLTLGAPPQNYNNAIVISDPAVDFNPQFSDIDIFEDGTVSVTWININFAFPNQTFNFRYTACTPAVGGAAAGAPTCDPVTTLFTENSPLQFGGNLASNTFRIATYPKHVHQIDMDGTTADWIVWDRCKTFPFILSVGVPVCPDADVYIMELFGEHFPFPLTVPVAVDASSGSDQFFIKARANNLDASDRNVYMVYHTTKADGSFKHRVQLAERKIPQAPSAFSPFSAADIKTVTANGLVANGLNDIDDEPLNGFFSPLFGDYIGLAARTHPSFGPRRYAGFTHNSKPGSYQGILRNQSDNALSKY